MSSCQQLEQRLKYLEYNEGNAEKPKFDKFAKEQKTEIAKKSYAGRADFTNGHLNKRDEGPVQNKPVLQKKVKTQ